MGDWEITTDSACLTERSEALEALSTKEKLELVRRFYSSRVPKHARKAPEEADALVSKNRRSFAKLVARIERKYDIAIDVDSEVGS